MGRILLLMLIGFAEGIVVGTAIAAFLTLLDIVPRLAQFTETYDKCSYYEFSIVFGAVTGALIVFLNWQLNLPNLIVVIIGLFMGIFIGLLAAALTEVLNVLPVLSKRLGLQHEIYLMLMSLILGKVAGSLIYWLVPALW